MIVLLNYKKIPSLAIGDLLLPILYKIVTHILIVYLYDLVYFNVNVRTPKIGDSDGRSPQPSCASCFAQLVS